MSKAINDLVALAASLTPSGEIGNGMVAHFHELARRVMDEQGERRVTLTIAQAEQALGLVEDMSRFVGHMALRDYAAYNEVPTNLRRALEEAKGS